jgi:hypothetical protein
MCSASALLQIQQVEEVIIQHARRELPNLNSLSWVDLIGEGLGDELCHVIVRDPNQADGYIPEDSQAAPVARLAARRRLCRGARRGFTRRPPPVARHAPEERDGAFRRGRRPRRLGAVRQLDRPFELLVQNPTTRSTSKSGPRLAQRASMDVAERTKAEIFPNSCAEDDQRASNRNS